MSRNPAGVAGHVPNDEQTTPGYGERPETRLVAVSDLHPAPWNPRLIKDKRFEQLCRSLQADPQFLWQRPILANIDGEVMAGNMRLRAAMHLGWLTVPAIVEDVPEKLAKERALRDNNGYGEWQEDDLAALLYQLEQDGSDLDLLGFDDMFLHRLRDDGTTFDPNAEWQGMPAFEHDDKTAYQSVQLHFPNAEAVHAFATLIEQSISPATKSLWYPKQENIRYGEAID